MLDQVVTALAAIQSEGTFAAELSCSSEDLRVEVAGIGPIDLPVSAATAQRLLAIARPAPFGKREKTLHDLNVRNTWEIEARLLKIDRRWRRTLDAQLALIQQRLGLSPEGKLVATLDKMLVYEPGQFFATHQDSERSDDMVGSLVVTLPSTSSGGEVVVRHHKEKKVFPGAKRRQKDLSLLAFYADCHHEVKPVKSGRRIVLTYHLRYEAGAGLPAPAELSATSVERLVKSVKAYFETPVVAQYSRAEPQRPDRLIYLLDHEYTQKSLGWHHLKNADRLRVSALRHAAGQLDCECFLALADVHESWQCEEEDWRGSYGRRGWRGRYRDDDDESSGDGEDHELVDLIETGIELRHWVGLDGRAEPSVPVNASSDEVCFTKASVDMEPFKSEHEGYMGNYGNTVDRWYHRAALVLWPRDRDFVIRAKVSPAWAVSQVSALAKAGSLVEAREKARSLLPFWAGSGPLEQSKTFFLKLLTMLTALGDADLSRGLLVPFGPDRLGPGNAPAFIALVEAHGLAWTQQIFSAWSQHARGDSTAWLAFLPRFSELLLARSRQHGEALAGWLLSREVASFKEDHIAQLRLPPRWREGGWERHLAHLIALLDCAAVIEAAGVRDDLLAFLTAPETALPLMTAGALLRKCREGRSPAAVRALGMDRLVRHVDGALERILKAPARAKDDWSIEPPMQCKCDLCQELSVFLRDRKRIEYSWPLAEGRRRHVHGIIDDHGLPVTHTTTRRGSPYTLVLTKQPSLFERAAALRGEQKALQSWLKKERRALTGARGE
jgi:hypothetical protein